MNKFKVGDKVFTTDILDAKHRQGLLTIKSVEPSKYNPQTSVPMDIYTVEENNTTYWEHHLKPATKLAKALK